LNSHFDSQETQHILRDFPQFLNAMSESHRKLGYELFLKILTNSPTCSACSFQATEVPLPPHLRFVRDRCVTTCSLSKLLHNTVLLPQLQAADMTKYCKYQAERFKKFASVFKKNAPLDKLMKCVAVTGHKNIKGWHIFGPKFAQLVFTFWRNSKFTTVFSKTLVSILSHVYPFTVHMSGTRHVRSILITSSKLS